MFLDLKESVKNSNSYIDEVAFLESCLELEQQWSELTQKAMKMEHYCYVQSNNGNRSEAVNLYSEGVKEWGAAVKSWFVKMWEKISGLIDTVVNWLNDHFSKAAAMKKALDAMKDAGSVTIKVNAGQKALAEDPKAGSAYVTELKESLSGLFKTESNLNASTEVNDDFYKDYNAAVDKIKKHKMFVTAEGEQNDKTKGQTAVITGVDVVRNILGSVAASRTAINELKKAKASANKLIKDAIKNVDKDDENAKKLVKVYKKSISLNNKVLAIAVKQLKCVSVNASAIVSKYIAGARKAASTKQEENDTKTESVSILDMFK